MTDTGEDVAVQAEPFTELVYDPDARAFFSERWPQATFKDASDVIHEGRFEVTIPGVTDDDVYPRLITQGWARCCLGFELRLLEDPRGDVRRWIDAAKALNARRLLTGRPVGSAVCPSCGLKVRTVVPRGGDGSAEVYVRHLAANGVTACEMSRDIVDPPRDDRDVR